MEQHDGAPILVEKAREGDRQAFDALIRDHGDRLERHVRLRIGEHLRHRVEVDDVLQEAYSQAWKSMARFRWTGEDAFHRWLRGIAENVILKLVSRERRDDVIFVAKEPLDPQSSPSTALRREERFDRLQAALDSLSPDYRQVVRLVRIEGLPVKEAALRMNRTPKAVMRLLDRALAKLKRAFGDTESLHLPPRRLKGEGGADGD